MTGTGVAGPSAGLLERALLGEALALAAGGRGLLGITGPPGAVPVEPGARLVVVEGNYLLHDDGAWSRVLGLLDVCWYVDLDDRVRVERLVARHVAHGRTPEAAREWVLRSDEANARLVSRGRGRATRVVPAMED